MASNTELVDRSKTEYEIREGDITQAVFRLKKPPIREYFYDNEYSSYNDQIKDYILNRINKEGILDIKVVNDELVVWGHVITNESIHEILESIRSYYEEREMHITRMFGSYILLVKEDGVLKAVKATPIPIKYCPLMTKLLKEVGGKIAETLLETLKTENEKLQTSMMCNLVNEVVIKGGYFDTNRPLNSCEANVIFGASETMTSAFQANLIDAAVIVSNNLGTIITTNASSTQGSVKRMTGLFYTSPSAKLIKTAEQSGIIPVFPYTATIDQITGVKVAIRLGYKNIAVSVAADDNYLHQQLKELESEHQVKIYKFGLCSTGIDNKTAIIMRDNADIVWSCASRQVRDYIDPASIAQVGIKIPVHVMTTAGWLLISNHLLHMNSKLKLKNIQLTTGNDKPVFVNDESGIKVYKRGEIRRCINCPDPCV